MKPAAFKCVGCQTEIVEQGHFATCKTPPAPVGWLLSIIDRVVGDKDHCDGKVTTTRLASCPRQILIEDFDDQLVFDPMRHNSVDFGSTIHSQIQKFTPEALGKVEWLVSGEIDLGEDVKVTLTGRIDFASLDGIIYDYKTASETSHKFKWNAKKPDENLSIQFGINAALAEQTRLREGVAQKFNRGVAWYGAMTSAKHPAPSWFPMEVPILPTQQIGNIKPAGGKTTVRDIARMLTWAVKLIKEIDAPRGTPEWKKAFTMILNEVPMVGESMFGGSKCALYCGPAQPVCFAAANRPVLL